MKKTFEGKLSSRFTKITSVISSTKFIVLLAAIIVVATFAAWQYHNTSNPDRVFWGMVNNNLSTSAYTRHTQQKSGAQSVDQIFQTATAPQHKLFSETVFNQTGADSATAVTENIGTPTNDYVRYTSIKTAQNLDFSSVLNVWGVTEPEVKGETSGQLYNQAVLGIIPVGNISASERRELVKLMKEKQAYSYTIVETSRSLSLPFGRPTYTMQVSIDPVGYITALKQFANSVGLNHLKDVNPADYASSQKLSFVVKIDGWTHQMIASDQNQGTKTEAISGRNMKKQLPDAPAKTIPVDELQTKLQAIE